MAINNADSRRDTTDQSKHNNNEKHTQQAPYENTADSRHQTAQRLKHTNEYEQLLLQGDHHTTRNTPINVLCYKGRTQTRNTSYQGHTTISYFSCCFFAETMLKQLINASMIPCTRYTFRGQPIYLELEA